MITRDQYIKLRRTWVDKILFHTWLLVIPCFVGMGIDVWIHLGYTELGIRCGVAVGFVTVIVIISRYIYDLRSKKFGEEYDETNKL